MLILVFNSLAHTLIALAHTLIALAHTLIALTHTLIALAHTLLALTHLNGTEKLPDYIRKARNCFTRGSRKKSISHFSKEICCFCCQRGKPI